MMTWHIPMLAPIVVMAAASLFCAAALAQTEAQNETQSPAQAQTSDPVWLKGLRNQLRADQQCETQYFLNVQELPSTAGTIYSARAYCEDGRSFDATRTDPNPVFTIDACTLNVCEVDPVTDNKS